MMMISSEWFNLIACMHHVPKFLSFLYRFDLELENFGDDVNKIKQIAVKQNFVG